MPLTLLATVSLVLMLGITLQVFKWQLSLSDVSSAFGSCNTNWRNIYLASAYFKVNLVCSLTIVRVRYHCNGNVIMKEVRRGYSNTVQRLHRVLLSLVVCCQGTFCTSTVSAKVCACDDCGKKVFALDHKGGDVVKADWFWRHPLCQALSVSNIKLIKRCEELSVTVPATFHRPSDCFPKKCF
jgi:hypothetical protein